MGQSSLIKKMYLYNEYLLYTLHVVRSAHYSIVVHSTHYMVRITLYVVPSTHKRTQVYPHPAPK